MSLISLHDISLYFDGPKILENLSLEIDKGQRICLLGRNGSGKSTLLKVISGEIKPDTGEVITGPGVKIAYLPQDVPTGISGRAFDVVAAGAGPLGESLIAYHQLCLDHRDPDRLVALQEEIEHHNGWQIHNTVERVLHQVQVNEDLDFESLSGGLRRRVFLARALVREPDLLLLDEPTNHLDLESTAWLESFLLGSRLTVLFVTHDRRLLRKLADRIIELDRGQAVDWTCNYTTFLERKQAVLDAEDNERARFDKKLAQEEVWIRRGVKARRARNEGRVRALEKMRAERRERRERMGAVSMTISSADRSGNQVLKVEHLSFAYAGPPLINDFSFTLMRGDRVGVVGPNGCGKTTMLNLLLGQLQPRQGTVEAGTNVAPIYFDQLREAIDPEKTVWENIAGGNGDTVLVNGQPRHVVSYLQDFLFTAERSRTKARLLSGGERHRLLLARLFTQPANLLIFDEPTNDLDTETLELLEEVLMEYPGTVIIVSHDREFLNNVVTSALLFLGGGSIKEYVGGYDDWARFLPSATPKIVSSESPRSAKPAKPEAPPTAAKKLSFKEAKELETLPGQIDGLEKEQQMFYRQMADPAFIKQRGFVRKSQDRLEDIEKELAAAYKKWTELDARPKK
jgi:ATP-binding cassette subfamily F protein uup